MMAAPLPALPRPERHGRVSQYPFAEESFPLKSHQQPRRSLIVLIPAHNEQTTVAQVVRTVKETLAREVVVIDDASTDATAQVARAAGATLLPLALRLGAWGAIQTGLRYALRRGYRSAVTMDADGQHRAAQISSLVKPLRAGEAEVVIGASKGIQFHHILIEPAKAREISISVRANDSDPAQAERGLLFWHWQEQR